jgi:hypothetical protein
MRYAATIAVVFLALSGIAQDTEGRVFHPVPLADVGRTVHTHVEVQGKVLTNRREADRDRHIILGDDSGHKLTIECIPEIPAILKQCAALKRGQQVKVQGISRIDRKHRWTEVHPVLHVQVIQ